VGEDLPAVRLALAETRLASIATTMHWLPNFQRGLSHEVAVAHRGGVDRHLVGPGEQEARMSSTLRTPPPTVRA
jgi:hypothetical protein